MCGVCGVWFIEQMLFAMLTSFRFGLSPWPHFQKYRTFPDILAVFMVGSDFSMNIPIKTTMNLQLHYTYSDQPSKMAVLEGTSTNYPNKSQLGRISYEFIKQNEKKKKKTVTKESIVTFSTIFMARQKHYKHYGQFNSKPRRRMPPRNSH